MSSDYPENGSSFRLVDLIAVIGLGAVAIGIGVCLLAKLQGPHCGSDRVKCSNNIRQIALGMHNCADAVGCMPPYRGGSGHGLPADNYFAKSGNEGSAFFFLLPFVEQNDLYAAAAVPSGRGVVHNVYATLHLAPRYAAAGAVTTPPTAPFAAGQYVKLFSCPCDPTFPPNGQLSADPLSDGNQQMFGVSSYVCNYLVFGNPDAVKNGHISNPDGYDPHATVASHAPSNAPRVPDSFPDGMSSTLLIAERLSQCNWTAASTTGSLLSGGTLWGPAGDNARYAPAFAMESPWNDGTTFQASPTPDKCNVAYPSTGHPGGMVVAMADGSARTLCSSISVETFRALCTPNGGDVIGVDF
jgi:prepilin-type processing-associated H-X9-DG protein